MTSMELMSLGLFFFYTNKNVKSNVKMRFFFFRHKFSTQVTIMSHIDDDACATCVQVVQKRWLDNKTTVTC